MLRGNKPRVQQRKREKKILSLIATVLHIIKYREKDRVLSLPGVGCQNCEAKGQPESGRVDLPSSS